MPITHFLVASVVTVSTAGLSYAALNPDRLERQTRVIAAHATCRTVESAIVAYAAENGSDPTAIRQIRPYVDGDISAYRIVRGRASGPGCGR